LRKFAIENAIQFKGYYDLVVKIYLLV